ncbi:MAG: sulfotransferase domain-containing protein, partial [Acidobacteria bacterium]|nr:sulfotransferase domain-containing protein [Acidobacteriota bacterium]
TFVAGAPKCGTTSLYMFFQEHPDVFVPERKELHFFSFPEVADTYYKVPFVTTLEEYLSCYHGAGRFKVTADVSPSYFFHETAAKRIYNFNPEARIIILLRNPVERAISHYLMDCQIGYQMSPLKDFFIKTDKNRRYFKEYIEMGFYSRQLRRYYDIFPENQILVIFSEEMKENEPDAVSKLCRFLGIREFGLSMKRQNVFVGLPRNNWIYRIRNNKFLLRIISVFPSAFKSVFKKFLLERGGKKPSFDAERVELAKIYRDDVEALSELLHLDLKKLWLM